GVTSTALFTLQIATAEQIAQLTRIESAYDDFGEVQGLLASGAITDDATPALSGRAEANSRVVIRYMLENGTAASVVVDADSAGNWGWTPAAALQTGLWTFDVQTQGRSGWSSPFKLHITGSGENSYKPVIDYAFDDAGAAQGERQSGTTTDDATPTLHGKAEANSIVYLQATHDGDTQTFSVKVNPSSHWEWTPPAELAQGNWKFQVSKSVGKGFGDVFELNINQVPPFGPDGSEDFSGLGNNIVIAKGELFKTPSGLIIEPLEFSHTINNLSYDLFGTVLASYSPDLPFYGKSVLRITFPKSQSVSFLAKDIQSPDNKFNFYDENHVLIGSKETTECIMGQTVNLNISFTAPSGKAISYMEFQPAVAGAGTDGVFFDNFKWQSEANNVSEIKSIDEDTTAHHFNGSEFITTADVNHEMAITGHENQVDSLQLTSTEQLFDLTALHNKIESVE
ncbi:Ig-like domain-containing protein, partial [Pantoea endophytica]|uniref:Ig-like domain-containing protein n=1 Tax=Pantoea endophytica TaxID=92488 RepID=UPI0024137CF2